MARKKRKKVINKEMQRQIKAVLLMAFSLFAVFCLVQTEQAGSSGQVISALFHTLSGRAALAVPIVIAFFSLYLLLPQKRRNNKNRLLGFCLAVMTVMMWFHLPLVTFTAPGAPVADLVKVISDLDLARSGGGLIGSFFSLLSLTLFGINGTYILMGVTLLIAVILIVNLSLNSLINKLVMIVKLFIKLLGGLIKSVGGIFFIILRKTHSFVKNAVAAKPAGHKHTLSPEPDHLTVEDVLVSSGQVKTDYLSAYQDSQHKPAASTRQDSKEVIPPVIQSTERHRLDPHKERVNEAGGKAAYRFPTLDLLALPATSGYQKNQVSKERAKLLENTLLSFGVKAKVIHVQTGPTVTRFEVQPEAGVKVSRFVSLADDLALNLAAPLVRIEAPIPGKAALGIEVPNSSIALVHLREVLEDQSFSGSPSPLTFAIGKDIAGAPIVADLTKMPHLLIAGATNAGKSVCLNTIITSILYKSDPTQVKFMMIDPKVVELTIYNGIPHLLMPVLTDSRKAALALRNMVREMGRRYELFAQLGIKDISAYNELTTEDENLEKMAYIVVVIDELADLMLVSPGEVEDAIARLAQMSRASGIHLVVATQRPSVDVLTGIIKANITSRIAFTVSSHFDSRTILDMAGAEKLLGRGDMLYSPVGAVKPYRVQGAYVSEIEIKKVTDFLKEQGLVNYAQERLFLNTTEDNEPEDIDKLFPEAVDLVVRTGQASISLLQRRFRIGYTRAARLIDELERRGVVGPFEGSKPREVLVTEEEVAKICAELNLREL